MPEAILLNVDDHRPARYARTRVLQHAGFEVHEAETGREALELVSTVKPDLILLDVNLPDMNGLEVCSLIKSREETASVMVVQITASAISAPQATAALNTGADTYLVEPVDPDVLVATVRAFLRLRNAERALARANRELSERNLDLHALNGALRRSNHDLEQFAYVASHDLQEPLRNITTHIQLLERLAGEQFNSEERRLFDVVVDSATRMSLLIRDVLAYSGLGKEPPALGSHQLQDSLAVALQNCSEAIASSGAVIQASTLPTVAGDANQLSRVFQNLVANAIKYRSPEIPPLVCIEAEYDRAGDWIIRVRDNGIGIPSIYLDKVFQPFKRLHGYEIPGNGIGLALCRRIIEAHGGRIWAESIEGQGATFAFTLHPANATMGR